MIRSDGYQYIKFADNVGLCYWAFDFWGDRDKRGMIEGILTDYDETDYLEYLKKTKR